MSSLAVAHDGDLPLAGDGPPIGSERLATTEIALVAAEESHEVDGHEKAWPGGDIEPWTVPNETIRLHVVWTANDDGSDPSPMSLSDFSSVLPGLNQIYDGLGLEFVFDPATDYETVFDTKLNKTFALLADPANYPNPNVRPPTESSSFKAARRAFADQHRGKLVLFLASPDRLFYDDDLGAWAIRCLQVPGESPWSPAARRVTETRRVFPGPMKNIASTKPDYPGAGTTSITTMPTFCSVST